MHVSTTVAVAGMQCMHLHSMLLLPGAVATFKFVLLVDKVKPNW